MIGVGIIGAGHFGAVHARAIAAIEGARISAVCHQDPSTSEAFAATYGGTPYDDWCRLLDDPSVDAVVIATPHYLHREMAVAGAGKHVLLEKPMALTVPDCDAIIAADFASARERRRVPVASR